MRRRAHPRRLLAGLVSAFLVSAGLVLVPGGAAADVTTVSVDTLRTGWDQNEPGLGPSAVSASDFGQLFSTAVNGQVYAQPIVVGGTVIAMTENNWIYGMNAATGVITWSRSVGPAWPASAIGCGDLVPNIGITSTPVYDPATNAVYFMAKVNDGPDANHPHFYLHCDQPGDRRGTHRLAGHHPGLAQQRPGEHVQPEDRGPAPRPAAARRRRLRRIRQPLRLRPVRRLRRGGQDDHAGDVDAVVHRGGTVHRHGRHLAVRRRPRLRRSRPDHRVDRQRRLARTRPRHQPARHAGRVGDPAAGQRRRIADRQGLLQPVQQQPAGPGRHRLRLRRSDGAAGRLRHARAPAPAGADRQGRPGLPARPGQPRRQRAGPRRYGRVGRSARGSVQRRVGPPRVLGRRRRLRLPGGEPGLPAGVQVRRQRRRPAGAQLGRHQPVDVRLHLGLAGRHVDRYDVRLGHRLGGLQRRLQRRQRPAPRLRRPAGQRPAAPAVLRADRDRDQVRHAGHRRQPRVRRNPRRQDLRLRPADHLGPHQFADRLRQRRRRQYRERHRDGDRDPHA